MKRNGPHGSGRLPSGPLASGPLASGPIAGGDSAPTLRPVAAAFTVFGVFWGSWAVTAADVEHDLRLSHGGFGLLLAFALAGAAVANAVTGALAERWGTAVALSRALWLWSLLLLLGTLARGIATFAPCVAAAFAIGGAVDVVMNIAATAGLADSPGRLVQFHAWFNAGAAVGAGMAGTLLHLGLTWRWVWVGVALVASAVGVACARATLPAGHAGDDASLFHAIRTVRAEHLVGLAIVFGMGALVEGGIDTWGVLYMRDELGAAVAVGAGASMAGYAVAAAGRLFLGPVAGSLGTARGLGLGVGLCSVGIAVVAGANSPGLAAAGLVVAAGGISVSWPLLLAHASTGRDRPAAVVGGISSVGYLGLVLGPPLIGGLAQLTNLRWAMLGLAGVAALVAIAPSRLRPPAAPQP